MVKAGLIWTSCWRRFFMSQCRFRFFSELGAWTLWMARGCFGKKRMDQPGLHLDQSMFCTCGTGLRNTVSLKCTGNNANLCLVIKLLRTFYLFFFLDHESPQLVWSSSCCCIFFLASICGASIGRALMYSSLWALVPKDSIYETFAPPPLFFLVDNKDFGRIYISISIRIT